MVTKIFIANRGEIARRIAVTCKKMGIKAAGILQKGARPPHYLDGLITEFVTFENDGTRSFLDADLLIKSALETGCDALHPGFGFLSENADFAKKVEEAGLKFIGPKYESIAKMANKDSARQIAEQHDVPCVPGLGRVDMEDVKKAAQDVIEFAASCGYPLMIKAAYGGGGKGMRLVHEDSQVEEAMQRAYSEAINAFGNGALLVEKYVAKPRHIEVQVLGDQMGNIVTLGDRDCSIQRRHQKIIEEAPALLLNEETRKGLWEAALRLSRAVEYKSAGTVEFLVDWSHPDKKQPFYFLEMNTRLQVEHPVTEEVFGVDLVEMQIEVARGKPLAPHLKDLKPKGHAIEVRVYAESCEENYMPRPGPIHGFFPYEDEGIRWERGLDGIDQITGSFDPMVSKVVAYGPTRKQAALRLSRALKETLLCGITCNREFLIEILGHEGFLDDVPSTSYLSLYEKDLLASMAGKREKIKDGLEGQLYKLWARLKGDFYRGERGAFMEATRRAFMADSSFAIEEHREYQASGGQISRRGEVFALGLRWCHYETPSYSYLYGLKKGFLEQIKILRHEGDSSGLQSSKEHEILAPVPGKVIKILGKKGGNVEKSQTVMILESMKMEFEVKAPKAGIIENIKVAEGDQVDSDEVLVTFE